MLALAAPVALAEDSLPYARHFEVQLPKKEAPKPLALTLPEERIFRQIPVEKLLRPIEADPSAAIEPDVVE